MENSSIPTREDHSEQAQTDLGSASLHPSVTAQTGDNTVDHREQKHADLGSVPCHSSVTAQTAGTAIAPQLYGSSVGRDLILNVNIQPDNKGVEDRGDGRLMKLLQDVCQGAGAAGSDDITGRKSGAVRSRPVTSGAEREPTEHHESCAGTELGGTQADAPSRKLSKKANEAIIRDKQTIKSDLKNKFEHVFEGLAKHGPRPLLNKIYTELYITEGGSGGVNNEHEVRQIETASKRQTTQETAILCNDIFKSSPGQHTIRTVLTKGIAGIGKTISVQKFILDWAEGKANQDIDLIFTLPFRDLNLIEEGETFSLMQLLQEYFPKLTFPDHFSQKELKSFDCKVVLFIFDGLDECRLALDFHKNKRCCDATKTTSVENLLTNLILGNLLPSARLWITSRPSAASQIPDECIDRVTEVRGFKDPQKEEYFVKRFSNQNLAGRIISHIKSSKSLYILCHIPVICWISAVVLETVFGGTATKVIPKTLTEMYTHFLLVQTSMKNKKYQGTNASNPKNMSASDVEIILKLGQLAFLQLQKGNLIFYEKDLRESGIDVSEASVYSGVCTEIFKEDCGLYRETVYCFVHPSIQEYLAALFVFHSFVNGNINLLCREDLEEDKEDTETSEEEYRRMPLSDLHRSAVDKALQRENGHLDLFLRFLLGLSLESTQDLLQDLLAQAGSSSQVQDTQTKSGSRSHETNRLSDKRQKISTAMSIQNTVKYIKDRINSISSAEKTINLFHCLKELNDNSLIEEIQASLRSGTFSSLKLNPGQCSTLAFLLLMSEKALDVFDLKLYNTSVENRLRLLTIIKNCRGAILSACNLTEKSCEIVASALQSDPSPLVELDLSNNDLGDSGVELLCHGLRSPYCQLETLRLSGCQVTKRGCASLASALRSNPSHLRELDLSYNHPGESGVRALSAGLEDPGWRLEKLNVDHGGDIRLKPGLTKYACGLTLDPDTAHSGLSLSERNRKVERLRGEQNLLPDHADRFDSHYQVLCREGLSDARFYWEAFNQLGDRLDSVAIGVAYRGIPRKGEGSDSLLGGNAKSWSVEFGDNRHTIWHNGRSTSERENSRVEVHQKRIVEFLRMKGDLPSYQSGFRVQVSSCKVGVYLDCPAGTLSFYKITPGSVTHLHTFHTTFTEPVYPAFGLLNPFCTVRLHMPD